METKNTKLHLENREFLSLNGVTKVISSNENQIVLKLDNTNLIITGANLTISSLNLTDQTAEIKGNIDQIKYTSKSTKPDNLFKRVFK